MVIIVVIGRWLVHPPFPLLCPTRSQVSEQRSQPDCLQPLVVFCVRSYPNLLWFQLGDAHLAGPLHRLLSSIIDLVSLLLVVSTSVSSPGISAPPSAILLVLIFFLTIRTF